MTVKKSWNLIQFVLLLGSAGCGGEGSLHSESFAAEVTEVKVSPSNLLVGQQTRVTIKFQSATFIPADLDQTDDDSPSEESVAFDLVVRLPRGLDFVDNSSTLTDSLGGDIIFGDPDKRGPNRIGICDDGSRFVFYQFADDELSATNPSSKELELTAVAYESAPAGAVSAAASSHISQPCFEVPEAASGVSIN